MIDVGNNSPSEVVSSAEQRLEVKLRELLRADDETGLDETWNKAQASVVELALRPAKRFRPRLLLLGYRLAGKSEIPEGVWTFATGLEILHTFLLIHDDVADRSALRRGGRTLHESFKSLGPGEDLAVVAGDHLFARSMEVMLTAGVERASAAAAYYLRVCRHTAIGQYLDIALAHRPLSDVSLFDAVKVCRLKTAKYSFAAPLACGAILAGAEADLAAGLERAGSLAGLAFQLCDDLIGIHGDSASSGKPGDADLREGKRTLPLLIAYRRAASEERRFLERLGEMSSEEEIQRVREIIWNRGGVSVTRRIVERVTRAAVRAIDGLPAGQPALRELRDLVFALGRIPPLGPQGNPHAAA